MKIEHAACEPVEGAEGFSLATLNGGAEPGLTRSFATLWS